MLDADFIIADEFSMADMALSFQFFNHIRQGARLVLVGDVKQYLLHGSLSCAGSSGNNGNLMVLSAGQQKGWYPS